MSSLERGLKSPTLEKVESLANRMNIHALTLMALAYMCKANDTEATGLLEQVKNEINNILRSNNVKSV